jgi:hypothetical protein
MNSEAPANPHHAAISGLAQHPNRFDPAERSPPQICVSTGSWHSWDSGWSPHQWRWTACRVLSHMTDHLQLADRVAGIIAFVSAQSDPLLPGNPLGYHQGRVALSRPRGLRHSGIDHQPVTIAQERMARVTDR